MQSTAKILAGAAGLTTAFVAGGFAKDKFIHFHRMSASLTMVVAIHGESGEIQ